MGCCQCPTTPAEISQKLNGNKNRYHVISGQEEASLIYENTHIAENMTSAESYLYIDVGGRKVRNLLFQRRQTDFQRILQHRNYPFVKKPGNKPGMRYERIYPTSKTKGYHHVTAIGSGGNINKIFSLSKRKKTAFLILRVTTIKFSNLSVDQRITLHKLRKTVPMW